jgi:hypothetical protein
MVELNLRVSVATLDKVVFRHPQDGTWLLALERKATQTHEKGDGATFVQAQPFGGGIRILDLEAFGNSIGDFQFDSERSQSEQDFRILIPSFKWEKVKQFCLLHLAIPNDKILESDPGRELTEEFADSLEIKLKQEQTILRPGGFVIENAAVSTDNRRAWGYPTVRIYHIFEVEIVDSGLCQAMFDNSERLSDPHLQVIAETDARNKGRGRANACLTLPLEQVSRFYLSVPLEQRYNLLNYNGHLLKRNVPALFENIDVPQYQRRPLETATMTRP